MKKLFTVKQIKFNKEEREYPNEFGWDGAIAKSPKWKAQMEYTRSFKDDVEFNPTDIQFYHDTFLVQAEDLEDVFRITNLWNDPDAVHTYEVGHSTSVGDIVVDNETNDHYMVMGLGFQKIEVKEAA